MYAYDLVNLLLQYLNQMLNAVQTSLTSSPSFCFNPHVYVRDCLDTLGFLSVQSFWPKIESCCLDLSRRDMYIHIITTVSSFLGHLPLYKWLWS